MGCFCLSVSCPLRSLRLDSSSDQKRLATQRPPSTSFMGRTVPASPLRGSVPRRNEEQSSGTTAHTCVRCPEDRGPQHFPPSLPLPPWSLPPPSSSRTVSWLPPWLLWNPHNGLVQAPAVLGLPMAAGEPRSFPSHHPWFPCGPCVAPASLSHTWQPAVRSRLSECALAERVWPTGRTKALSTPSLSEGRAEGAVNGDSLPSKASWILGSHS